MCLFVIDGTWSRDFNSKSLGLDSRDRVVGKRDGAVRSNSRRFFDESQYPPSKKFYYGGPRFGITGADAKGIYNSVVTDIEREIVNGSCTEICLVGWSRGAAIATEVAQGLLAKEYARIYKKVVQRIGRNRITRKKVIGEAKMLPEIKFVGLFDSVEMIPFFFGRSFRDREWGEVVPERVNYFFHIIAGDRDGPLNGLIDFKPANPLILARQSFTHTIAKARHDHIGGVASHPTARQAYQMMRTHASAAGVR